MKDLVKIGKEFRINFFGSLIGMALNYLWLIILTRFLSPDDYGLFVLGQAVANLALIFVLFGTHRALDRFIPFYQSSGEPGKTKALITRLFSLAFFLSLLVSTVVFFCSDFISLTIFKKPGLPGVMEIIVLSIPLLAFIQLVVYTFIGYKELRYSIYIQQFAAPLLYVITGSVVFAAGYGLLGWTWMYILSLGGAASLAAIFFHRHIGRTLKKVKKAPISFSKILNYSWPLSINSIMLLFMGQIDFLFLGYYRSSTEVGVYRVYIYLAVILALVMQSFAKIYKPVISEQIARHNPSRVNFVFKRVSKWIFIINAFGMMIFLIFGHDIIRIFFTEKYLVAPAALLIFVAGRFVNSAFGPEGMTLEAFGNTKLLMINSLIMVATNLGLDFWLVPKYGIYGAAIATSVSGILGGAAGLIEIYWLYRIQPYSQRHLKSLACILGSTGVGYFMASRLPHTFLGIAIMTLILGGVYTAGLVVSRCLDGTDFEVFLPFKAHFLSKGGIK